MKKNVNIYELAFASIITALMLLLGFTPLGYIKTGSIEITIMHIPVAIGSAVLGWKYGIYFGFVFGATSLAQAFMGSPFGQICLNMSVVFTIILCIVPRMLMGFLTGLISESLHKGFINKPGIEYSLARHFVVCLSSPVFNTLFFVGGFVLLFGNNPAMVEAYGNVIAIISAMITLNAVVEILACCVVGVAVCTALEKSGLLKRATNKTTKK